MNPTFIRCEYALCTDPTHHLEFQRSDRAKSRVNRVGFRFIAGGNPFAPQIRRWTVWSFPWASV